MDSTRLKAILKSKPAAQLGAHASAGSVAKGYDQQIVADQVAYLEETERWSLARMRAHQVERLRDLLCHAGANVPFYRRVFKEIGFDPTSFSDLAELERLPIIDKDVIKDNYTEFVAETVSPEDLLYMTTGGSTGTPLKVFMDCDFRSRNHANTHYYLAKAGFRVGASPHARLHGNKIAEDAIRAGKYWIEEGNRLTMSVYHISEETTPDYMAALAAFRPAYIHAYPSAISLLATYAERLGIGFPDSIGCVFCDSETTYPWQQKLIERTTGGQVLNTYGHTEGCVVAITFPGSPLLNVLPQVGLVELIVGRSMPSEMAGAIGEIVATGLSNRVFPLIRYRTNDIATLAPVPDDFTRPYRPLLSSVQGRLQDYLVNANGELVPAAPALFDYNIDWTGVSRFRLCQENTGQLEMQIVAGADSSDHRALAERLRGELSNVFGPGFTITVTLCSDIPHTARGKYRYVEQKLRVSEPVDSRRP